MKVGTKSYRSIWMNGTSVMMIEQNKLPFNFSIHECKTVNDTCNAIKDMTIRGAGSIGAAAAYAMLQTILTINDKNILYKELETAKTKIDSTRPTAVNLSYATSRVLSASKISKDYAIKEAQAVVDECAEQGRLIGIHGNKLIQDNYTIETHCNAGWLALVDYGSALAPIYEAHLSGKKIHVLVDETAPRSQGAKLTAWELAQQGIKHTIIPDNAGAHYMSQKKIDLIIVGADRIAANGDTANKIGTLEKAIAAKYYNIPFYVAAPTPTIDPTKKTGTEIPIEQRDEKEVLYSVGIDKNNRRQTILTANPNSTAYNPAFDVTPASLITGIITEKGIIKADKASIIKVLKDNN